MPTLLHYVAGLLKAAVPPLFPWATSRLARARIRHPEDNDVVTVGKIPVSGTYRFECGLSFVLLHHYENKYWPQGSPFLDRTRHWKKDVHITTPLAEKHSISIASITEDARPLFNHYYQVGESTKRWHPIILYKLPNGLTILHTECNPKRPDNGSRGTISCFLTLRWGKASLAARRRNH